MDPLARWARKSPMQQPALHRLLAAIPNPRLWPNKGRAARDKWYVSKTRHWPNRKLVHKVIQTWMTLRKINGNEGLTLAPVWFPALRHVRISALAASKEPSKLLAPIPGREYIPDVNAASGYLLQDHQTPNNYTLWNWRDWTHKALGIIAPN